MALAGHQDGIAGLCKLNGTRDGGAAVGLNVEAALALPHARHDIGDDGIGILGAGVVGRDHGMVGRKRGTAHDGALRGIAVAAAAEHADGAAGRERHDGA